MAVATDADLIFLDEPTLGLTRSAAAEYGAFLTRSRRRTKHTTHDPLHRRAEILSSNVAIIDHGRLVLSGSPAELLRNLKERVRVDIVGTTFSPEELSKYGRVVKLAERFRVLTDDQQARELADEAMKRGSDVV